MANTAYWARTYGLPLLEYNHELEDNRWTLRRKMTTFVYTGQSKYHLDPYLAIQVYVPPTFRTDLASIPKILRPLFPIDGKHIRAAIFHDYLYRVKSEYTRAQADRMFLEIMLADGVAPWRANSMYAGVRAFGGGSFKPQ